MCVELNDVCVSMSGSVRIHVGYLDLRSPRFVSVLKTVSTWEIRGWMWFLAICSCVDMGRWREKSQGKTTWWCSHKGVPSGGALKEDFAMCVMIRSAIGDARPCGAWKGRESLCIIFAHHAQVGPTRPR